MFPSVRLIPEPRCVRSERESNWSFEQTCLRATRELFVLLAANENEPSLVFVRWSALMWRIYYPNSDQYRHGHSEPVAAVPIQNTINHG